MGFFKKIFGRKNDEVKELDDIVEGKKEEKLEETLENVDENIEDQKQELEENIEEPVKEKVGFFASLKEKLSKSRDGFFKNLKNFFTGKTIVDGEMYEELEDLLIQSDIGMEMTLKIVEKLKEKVKEKGIKKPEEVYPVLKEVLERFLIVDNEGGFHIENGKINVILVVGVNGVGKTTTIGKLASKYSKEGKKVVLGAADTFRAAAIEQLEEWAKRANVEIVKQNQGADPGAVVFDTLTMAENKGADVVILDTAGRLHNKNNLMKELEKINNIIKRKIGDSYYESILVIDGTTGQNGLSQAKVFNEVTKLTGFIITKLDGTAKGGIVFAISDELKKPIKYIGVGEKIEDLREFNSKEYIEAIFD